MNPSDNEPLEQPVPSDLPEETWEAVVIGAGAAGLMAAATSASFGRRTLLLEKNRKPGVKILMSGGTRCNITQSTNNRGIVTAYGPPGRFLHSALAAFGVDDSIAMFEAEGVKTKVESTGKIFPASDKAVDVLTALLARLERSGCTLALEEPATSIVRDGDGFKLQTPKRIIRAGKLLITTGGKSYPGCGTSGDAYEWLAELGHTIVTPRPALVPITTDALWVRELRGITIPDVLVRVVEPGDAEVAGSKASILAEQRGSFLFAHFGLSGPAILDVSRAVSSHAQPRSLQLMCDFLPNIAYGELDEHLRREVEANPKKQLANLVPEELPKRLCESLLTIAGLSPEHKAAEVGSKVRIRAVEAIKRATMSVSGTCGFGKAEVTAGGVALDEVDSKTMRSKRVENLYLAGEVLDLDGPIGGYNFQAAWSTGFLAGRSLSE